MSDDPISDAFDPTPAGTGTGGSHYLPPQHRAGGASTDVIEDVIPTASYPPKWPYLPPDFARMDENDDSFFYMSPRFVTHIDDAAISALTSFYSAEFDAYTNGDREKPIDVLDICSSWISHLPTDRKYGKVVGVGMNDSELKRNPQLTSYILRDLNESPSLPNDWASSFDFAMCVVSVDYLVKPLNIFAHVRRCLRPGGKFIVSFSNRCFPTKAWRAWLSTDKDADRVWMVGSFFHYSTTLLPPAMSSQPENQWARIYAKEITLAREMGGHDPMFVVVGEKAGGGASSL
ncbi:hypothetical protein DFJ74DRAFT_711529 [Hyaloraphidium curvatum]|nr:hypothetical protein DFJ74DRAFT_711529 [Hyaloraphidium curvatum]